MYLFVVIVVHGALFATPVRAVFVIAIAAVVTTAIAVVVVVVVVHDVSVGPHCAADVAAAVSAAVSTAARVAAADVAADVLAAAADDDNVAVGQIVDLVVGPHLQHHGVMW